MPNRRVFIKDAGLLAAGLGLFPSLLAFGSDNRAKKAFALPRSSPEAQGISSTGISKFM
jgi:hypothetical protein